ncbi:MAG: M50 family metallopeptidase [Dehalococcoidia bacterium]
MDVLTHSVLPFVLILVVLVVVHELGHFITARMAGVKVLEFGIGYPPKLWGITRGETEYTINALPLGGFVRLLGEEDPGDPRSLAAQSRLTRIFVLSAGAFMNLILAIILFAMALMIPHNTDISRASIVDVVPGSPAAKAGLQAGDVIFAINHQNVQNIAELGYRIRLHLGETIDVLVKRPGTNGLEDIEVPVKARWTTSTYVDKDGITRNQGPTGITISPHYGTQERLTPEEQAQIKKDLQPGETVPTTRLIPASETQRSNPLAAFKEGAIRAWEWVIFTVKWIISLVLSMTGGGQSGIGEEGVRGPVGIAQITGDVVKQAGWQSLLELAAVISMSLAALNILPLPMLDGGRVAFVVIELLRGGKRIAPEREAMVHFVGLVAILGLAVVITYFDVLRLFEG